MHKVVLQLTSNDHAVQKSALSHIHNIQKAFEHIVIELVTHGDGIELLLKESPLVEKLQLLHETGVQLLICQNAMDAKHLSTSDFLSFSTLVPSAVAHLIVRQSEGWSYLRETF